MQVIVNSLLANYEQKGTGDALLLLHGWGDSIRGLAPFSTELSKKYQVTALDLPGFGGTQAPPQPWGLDEYADFVIAFAQKVGVHPAIIVGHSNGGAIALRCLSRGLSAKQLVLVASAGIRSEYKGRKKLLRIGAKTGKLLTAPLPASVKKRLRRKVYSTIGSDLLVAEHLQETFKRVVEDDVRRDAADITLPTLLIYGDKDVSTPLRYGEMLHQAIKNSKLKVISGGEHMLPTDNTAETIDYIEEFAR